MAGEAAVPAALCCAALRSAEIHRAQPGALSRSAARRFRVLSPVKVSPPPPRASPQGSGETLRPRSGVITSAARLSWAAFAWRLGLQPQPRRRQPARFTPCNPGPRSSPAPRLTTSLLQRSGDGGTRLRLPPAGRCFPAGPYCQRTAGGRRLRRRRRRAEASAGSAPRAGGAGPRPVGPRRLPFLPLPHGAPSLSAAGGTARG